MSVFSEVADRVWTARLPSADVNVTVVGGTDGLLVVDSYVSTAAGRELLEEVRRLGGPVKWLVNTHDHYDHAFGNGAFAEAGARILAHEEAARILAELTDPEPDFVAPHQTFSSVAVVDLGDRQVELIHPGRGHTGGDCVVRVADAGVLVAGDLVEEAEGAVVAYGEDSWPMDWPGSLDMVLQLVTPGTVVVPGHGAVVDKEFVEDQRNHVGVVSETIRDLAERGVPASQALEVGEWPWPVDRLGSAVERGYAQLPRSQKRLPLV